MSLTDVLKARRLIGQCDNGDFVRTVGVGPRVPTIAVCTKSIRLR